MAATVGVLASAVIVPDNPSRPSNERTPPSSPDSLKRARPSEATGDDERNKRPRLGVNTESATPLPGSTDQSPTTTPTVSAVSEPTSATPDSATVPNSSRLRATAPRDEAERRRNKRLFGSLIGTLSRAPTSNAQKRREEIEKRQAEKLKAQTQEADEDKRKRLNELAAKRQAEQQKWEEKSVRIRHANRLSMARFLHTSNEPMLYYLPWELRDTDKIMIEQQLLDAKAKNEREMEDFLKLKRDRAAASSIHHSSSQTPKFVGNAANGQRIGEREELEARIDINTVSSNVPAEAGTGPIADATTTDTATNEKSHAEPVEGILNAENADADTEKEKDDDIEEIVDGMGENAVIY